MSAGVPWELVANVLGHTGTRMAALVYRHALAPTVEAGAVPMQRLPGEGEGGCVLVTAAEASNRGSNGPMRDR